MAKVKSHDDRFSLLYKQPRSYAQDQLSVKPVYAAWKMIANKQTESNICLEMKTRSIQQSIEPSTVFHLYLHAWQAYRWRREMDRDIGERASR